MTPVIERIEAFFERPQNFTLGHVKNLLREAHVALKEGEERAVKAVEVEEELPGLMPEGMFESCETIEGASHVMRYAIITTKRNIIDRLRGKATAVATEKATGDIECD